MGDKNTFLSDNAKSVTAIYLTRWQTVCVAEFLLMSPSLFVADGHNKRNWALQVKVTKKIYKSQFQASDWITGFCDWQLHALHIIMLPFVLILASCLQSTYLFMWQWHKILSFTHPVVGFSDLSRQNIVYLHTVTEVNGMT